MSDQSYDSVLIGICEEPRYYEGELSSWSVKFKDSELKEMIDPQAEVIPEQNFLINQDGFLVATILILSF